MSYIVDLLRAELERQEYGLETWRVRYEETEKELEKYKGMVQDHVVKIATLKTELNKQEAK